MTIVRDADFTTDLESIRQLWLAYLTWGSDEMEMRHGFRLPVEEAVENDLATITKFAPPYGRLFLAVDDTDVAGIA
jgi:hypothetical protein